MTAGFFLMLREGLEASLIVGIIAAYLVKIGRPDAMPRIWLGVGGAVAVSVAAGLFVATTVGQLPLAIQETVEGSTSLLAVVVLTWMLFWMRRQGRAMKGELERGVDVALAVGSTTALAGLAFVAVVREGLEAVLFLYAVGSSTGSVAGLMAASLAGLAAAVAIGWAIFALGVRIDLRRFFTVTGVVLVFVSGGLVAFAIAEFSEAGLLRASPVVVDLGEVLPVASPIGSLLAGLFGYRDAPTTLELAGYLLYVVPILMLFIADGRLPRAVAVGSAAAFAAAVLVTGFGGESAEGAPGVSEISTIEVAASEYAFTPNAISVPAGRVSFHVTNVGEQEHEFEIFRGDQVVDEVEGLVPGLDRTLTVDLAAGDYTFVCKLAGHDLAGMTGTLTVSAADQG